LSLAVPDWTRRLRADGWANIHDIVAHPPRLAGIDSFLGDTSAHTLILGKDCAPASEFRKRVKRGESDPYRHNPKLLTNRRVSEVLAHVGVHAPLDGSNAKTCGIYYANAYWLLRDDDRFSGALPNRDEARRQSALVIKYLFEQLPLKRVIAMGVDAYEAVTRIFSLHESWRGNLDARRAVSMNGVKIVASAHPGHFGPLNRIPGGGRANGMAAIIEDWKRGFDV
jgi:hypothetical protein